ncbi:MULTISPECIES: acyl-CoA synthetase [Mycolicibacterium]|uniref:Acyl-CoA synthetase, long-chain fatty acid:CoA ligase n=1 Tax=Mycolicibacterium senegalense TaxID=1796 RepID=A0A378WG77_9MYCO|nr:MULTISPECIES: acyl-CoA synthetase [Mycolicibacterium]MCV7336447.1 acyl-CoA synthetase [Mycolicibacterium senegalense]MDR7291328.1 fatty-acyl-CoA synthase [Mycolicibacterium senegalense]QZA22826.1 acyl-CoA synthetase [Mycolicibacterium senegalense]CDP84025.1 acyl-CoA synthetase [Mycolicibacterium farcinogenes]SUA32281.1 acyl-CoA synthetase, long-chain fatty acid:CoA ligase [Mycolicibacterium senegalense]
MAEWTIGAVVDAIAEAVPDREMTVCGVRRSTFAQGAEQTRRLANFLASRGLGARRERSELNRWECGQDVVALVMHNDLYPEMVIGCLKARTVPVNVNYYYSPGEVADLLAYLKPCAVIYHRSLGAKFAEVLRAEVLISVDDGEGDELPGSVRLEDALQQGDSDHGVTPSPDDLLMVCTGGTTGRPKGVMWRQGDIYVSSMNGADHDRVSEIHDKVANAGPPWFAVSPLMHAAGLWTAFSGLLSGQTVVLHDTKPRFDPRAVLETAQRERIGLMTMVGDAYAGPIVEELGRRTYDLASMFAIGTGGAATNPKHQRALLEHLPQITIINGFGSSETGNMGFGHTQRETPTAETFQLRAGGLVLADDYSRFLDPGDPEVGWVARNGRIPLGYFNDEAATVKTFPEVAGERVVVSGDRASLDADGTLRLFGRDSLVVNTGGEKVFVEEIEEVLRAHPHVVDALAVGRPSERWGEEVVALVSIRDAVDAPALREHCATRLARFKLPKDVLFVEEIRRLGNGKADYRWAKSLATERAEIKA